MNRLTLPAPAKLNLFLHVTGQRDDGYHLLQTVFQLLDYGDTLKFETRPSADIRLIADLPGVPANENLVYKAAIALKQATNTHYGADIQLIKRLPSGGGLGGGSSDAATTLLALNTLWQLNLAPDQLMSIGLKLGADVPVFILGQSAWAEGIGEIITPVVLPEHWYLVVFPGCRVDTGQIFGHRELTRNDLPITIRAFRETGGKNSCQPVVEKLYPAVQEARIWLQNYAPAQMTGTGSCLFARFDSETAARAVKERLPGQWEGFVAKGVNRSPTHAALTESL